MSKSPWVKWYSGDFLNGIADLEPNEIAVYVVVLNRIYDEGGPISDDVARIARRCHMRPSSCEKALSNLLRSRKLTRVDGLLSNDRCEKEIKSREEVSNKSSISATTRWKNSPEKPSKNNDAADALAMRSQCEGNAYQKPEARGQSGSSLRSERSRDDVTPLAFGQFWRIYPNKVGKPTAEKAFAKALKAVDGDLDRILDGLGRYMRDKPPDRSWLNPSTFLNQARYDDEPATSQPARDVRAASQTRHPPAGLDAVTAAVARVQASFSGGQHREADDPRFDGLD
jgi:uncharacterized protein YdaU (DUF1376 family)